MTKSPPPLLESAVLRVLPPLVREEVAGDLAERYRGPIAYLGDALRALPHILASQLRRGGEASFWLLTGMVLFVSLGGLEPGRGIAGPPAPLRALAATLPTMLTLVLSTIYRGERGWNGRRALADVMYLAAALVLSQLALLIVAPAWMLAPGWLFGGFAFSATMMVLLRAEIELADTGPGPGLHALADLEAEFRAFRRNLRLRTVIETGVLGLLAGVATWFALTADRPVVAAVAAVWAIVTGLVIASRVLRAAASPRPSGTGGTAALFGEALAREHGMMPIAWWWYFSPLFVGLVFSSILFGFVANRIEIVAIGLTGCAALGAMLVRVWQRRTDRLAAKIARLGHAART